MTNDTVPELRFWMVWNPMGREPRHKHFSRSGANREAERLARENPQETFYVLKCMKGFLAPPSPVSTIKMITDHDALPF